MSEELQQKYEAALATIEEMSKIEDQLQADIVGLKDQVTKLGENLYALSEKNTALNEDLRLANKGKEVALKGFESQSRMHEEQRKRAEQHKRNQEQAEKILGLVNVDDEQAKVEVEKLNQMKKEL